MTDTEEMSMTMTIKLQPETDLKEHHTKDGKKQKTFEGGCVYPKEVVHKINAMSPEERKKWFYSEVARLKALAEKK